MDEKDARLDLLLVLLQQGCPPARAVDVTRALTNFVMTGEVPSVPEQPREAPE